MGRFSFLIFVLFFPLAGCAGHPPAPPPIANEKEFQVPANLADEFAVRDENSATSKAGVHVDPIPVAPPEVNKKDGKKKNAKGAKKEKMKSKTAEAPSSLKSNAAAEIPNRWNMAPFFRAGERTVFDITYFGATAGQLELDVLPEKTVADRPTYHFRAIASSTSIFSLFYRVNDVAESFMDTVGLFSHKFSLKLDESKQTRDVLELYDQNKRKAYYWSKLETQIHGKQNDQSEIELVPFTQDGLSSFFYVRTLPLELNKTYEFPVVNNGKLRTVRVTALRKEELVTRHGEFKTIVVKPEVVLDGADRQILKIDAKIKVGSVIAYLRERSNGATSP